MDKLPQEVHPMPGWAQARGPGNVLGQQREWGAVWEQARFCRACRDQERDSDTVETQC